MRLSPLNSHRPCSHESSFSFVAHLRCNALALSVNNVCDERVGGQVGFASHDWASGWHAGVGGGWILAAAVAVVGIPDGECSAVCATQVDYDFVGIRAGVNIDSDPHLGLVILGVKSLARAIVKTGGPALEERGERRGEERRERREKGEERREKREERRETRERRSEKREERREKLAGWLALLVGWLVCWLVCWRVGLLVDWLVGWLVGLLVG